MRTDSMSSCSVSVDKWWKNELWNAEERCEENAREFSPTSKWRSCAERNLARTGRQQRSRRRKKQPEKEDEASDDDGEDEPAS